MKEPKTFNEALKMSDWCNDMDEEYHALMYNKTWDLVPFDPSMNVVGNKYVFRLKRRVM